MKNTVNALLIGLACMTLGASLAATQKDQNAADIFGFSGLGVAAFVIFIGGICDVIAAYRGKP